MTLLEKVVKMILRSGLRGKTRLTLFMARRLQSLHAVPVPMAGSILYADLRIITTHTLLLGEIPDEVIQNVIKKIVMPGDVALDIGAHIGYHTLLLSKIVGPNGKVYAFEPNPDTFFSLEQTVKAHPNISLSHIALSDKSGAADLFIPGDPSMASLADWTDGKVGKTHKSSVELSCLDVWAESIRMPQPAFIKCDVEGAELSVFRGGMKMLDRIDAPIILFEANAESARAFGEDVSSTMEFLVNLEWPNYSFFEVMPEGALLRIQKANPIHSDILAVPRSKINRWPALIKENRIPL